MENRLDEELIPELEKPENLKVGVGRELENSQELVHYEDKGNKLPALNDEEFKPYKVSTNHLVMVMIFESLSLDSLKNCRLVCETWRDFIEPIFKRKIQVVLKNPEVSHGDISEDHPKTSSRFLSDFTSSSQINCGRYRFNPGNYPSSHFFEIFHRDWSTLTSLTLVGVIFRNTRNAAKDSFNLDCVFHRHTSLRDLTISCPKTNPFPLKSLPFVDHQDGTIFTMSIEKLACIKHLDLENCLLFIRKTHNYDIKCLPKTLKLKEVTFFRQSFDFRSRLIIVKSVRLNVFFGFGNAQEIFLSQNNCTTKLDINLSESFQHAIECVEIHGQRIRLTTTKSFKLKKLVSNVKLVDPLTLPDSLECLDMRNIPEEEESESLEIPKDFLPNLGRLICSFEGRSPSYLYIFSDCPKLKFVRLEGIFRACLCDLKWLPHSVEILHVQNIHYVTGMALQFDLIKQVRFLFFGNCFTYAILDILKKIHTADLLVHFVNYGNTGDNLKLCSEVCSQGYFKNTFTIGGSFFDWGQANRHYFDGNEIPDIVERNFDFQAFSKGNGKDIDPQMLTYIENYVKSIRTFSKTSTLDWLRPNAEHSLFIDYNP